MKKVLYASAIYPCQNFSFFAKDFFENIKNQTYQNFDLFLFLDCVSRDQIQPFLNQIKQQEIILHSQNNYSLTPAQIRHHILQYAYIKKYDLLIFADFDETVAINLIEEHIQQIGDYYFGFNDFYPTNKNQEKITNNSFFRNKTIPPILDNTNTILKKNFVGLGSSSIKPLAEIVNIHIPTNILAYDWFLFTYMLIHNYQGKQIFNTYGLYRQHEESYIGIGTPLNLKTLTLGLAVKKAHYNFFSTFSVDFLELYKSILEVEKYLEQNQEKYIKIINQHFNPATLCWWENIKTLEEIKQWI